VIGLISACNTQGTRLIHGDVLFQLTALPNIHVPCSWVKEKLERQQTDLDAQSKTRFICATGPEPAGRIRGGVRVYILPFDQSDEKEGH
jgi:hypothetical protein